MVGATDRAVLPWSPRRRSNSADGSRSRALARSLEELRRAKPEATRQRATIHREGSSHERFGQLGHSHSRSCPTASGTQTGQSAGVAPTGKRAEFSGVNIFRFGDDGKVTEIWNHRDDLGLMEQLGVSVYAGAGGDMR